MKTWIAVVAGLAAGYFLAPRTEEIVAEVTESDDTATAAGMRGINPRSLHRGRDLRVMDPITRRDCKAAGEVVADRRWDARAGVIPPHSSPTPEQSLAAAQLASTPCEIYERRENRLLTKRQANVRMQDYYGKERAPTVKGSRRAPRIL